jgi:hypothetical protein
MRHVHWTPRQVEKFIWASGYIQLSRLGIELTHTEAKDTMFRVTLYVLGITAFVAAWAVYQNQQKTRPVPAKKAAEMLQNAWANYHTRA